MTPPTIGTATIAAQLLSEAASGLSRASQLLQLVGYSDAAVNRHLSDVTRLTSWIRLSVDGTIDLARSKALGDAAGELRARTQLAQAREGLAMLAADTELGKVA